MGLTSVHAHTNLFGWATLALCGFTYLRFPKAAKSRLAKWHFSEKKGAHF